MWATIGASLVASALLVAAYRRGVQGRPVLGREAHHVPTIGVGIARFRRRIGLEHGDEPGGAGSLGELVRTYDTRRSARRAATIERRRAQVEAELAPAAASTDADLTPTMRVAWELVAALRGSLLSLEERATRIVPAEVAGLIAIWTQLGNFDSRPAAVAAWIGW